jgi:hypothetical protein
MLSLPAPVLRSVRQLRNAQLPCHHIPNRRPLRDPFLPPHATPFPFIFCSDPKMMQLPDSLVELIQSHPESALMVEWSPQQTVLSHPVLGWFVSHCGTNSASEAIIEEVGIIGTLSRLFARVKVPIIVLVCPSLSFTFLQTGRSLSISPLSLRLSLLTIELLLSSARSEWVRLPFSLFLHSHLLSLLNLDIDIYLSLFPLPSSLFPLPSSLFPLPSSLFPLPSSLFPSHSSLPNRLLHRPPHGSRRKSPRNGRGHPSRDAGRPHQSPWSGGSGDARAGLEAQERPPRELRDGLGEDGDGRAFGDRAAVEGWIDLVLLFFSLSV